MVFVEFIVKKFINLFYYREVLFGFFIDRISCCDLIKLIFGDCNMNFGNLR